MIKSRKPLHPPSLPDFAALSLGLLLLGLHGRALAQDQATESKSSQDMPVRVGAIVVDGSIDPAGRVEALLQGMAGTTFVASGDADRVGIPIGTIPRMKRMLTVLGYAADITPTPTGGELGLQVHLRAMDRVRRIFVTGNQSLFGGVRQEELIGKLSIRPGQRLPPAGPEREAFLASETEHVLDHLRTRGYWEAKVSIELHDNGKVPAAINLLLRVDPGPSYLLGPISVTGATALPSEDITEGFRHLELRWLWVVPWLFHQPFRRSVLRDDTTALVHRYRKIGFPGVRVQDDFDPLTSVDTKAKNVHLGLAIKERRHIEVAFEGNRTRSAGELIDALTLLAHGSYDDVEATASAAALERSYREQGCMFAKVTWRRERISEDSDRIVFQVEEGPVLKVRSVSFVGNKAVSSETLAETIRTHEFPALGFLGLGEGGFASLLQLELDVKSIADHYAAVGYPDTVVRVEISPSAMDFGPLPTSVDKVEQTRWRAATSLYARFVIEESKLLWVASTRVECDGPGEQLPKEEDFFLHSLRTAVGAPYQPTLIRSDEARIKRMLGNEGYIHAQVEARNERRGDQMHLVWKVKLGPQVRVGPNFLRGNFLTREHTILTWAELRTGDVLTTRGIERAQRNLAMIQLFNNPNPVRFPSEDPNASIVPMLVEVEERHDHLGVFRIGGGISTDQASPTSTFPLGTYVGAYGALGYEHRNLFGHGWTLTSQGAYGSSLKSAIASFLNPRFLDSLVRLELNGSYLQQATLRLGDIHSGTLSLGFSREMYPGIDANIHYNLRNTSRTELLDRSAGPFQDQTTVRIGTFVSSFSAGIEWHRLDNVLVPSRGFKVAAGVEVARPAFFFNVGQDAFVKLYGRGFSVVPLLHWLSLRYSIRYDQGLPLEGAALLPKVERYFAGGDTTIRGYQLDYALTETVRTPSAPGVTNVQYRPLGGNLRILQNIDLQFPIARPLYGSIFLDSGVVAYSLDDIAATDFRHGLGFSPLLLKLPVGDLSLSFAVPLNRRPGDDAWRVHFNVGLMF